MLAVDNQGRLVFGRCRGSNILLGSPLFIGYWQTDKHSVTAIYGQLVNAICQTQWEDIRGVQNWEPHIPFFLCLSSKRDTKRRLGCCRLTRPEKGPLFSGPAPGLWLHISSPQFIIDLVVWLVVAVMFVQMSTTKLSCSLSCANKCSAPIEQNSRRVPVPRGLIMTWIR